MKTIKIKDELREWIIDYITKEIHNIPIENKHIQQNDNFIIWAKSFKRDEAEFLVDMEFIVDWGYDERTEISEEEAVEYAHSLIKIILDNWYR